MTCSGSGGTSAPATATCTVTQPTVDIGGNPERVTTGGSSTITWNATDTGTCTISGPGLSATSKSGSQAVNNLTEQSVYTITCQTPNGPLSKSVTVNIVSQFQEF